MKRSTLIGLGLGSVALAAISPSSLVTISTEVDSSSTAAWWTPLDEFGGYDWLAYLRNLPSGPSNKNQVMLVRREISSGAINRDCLKTTAGGDCAVFADDAGHNAPSVAVDGDGYVHVFTSMHNEHWKYFRSTDSQSPSNVVDRSDDMPDQTVNFTYPVIKRDASGDLWLIARGWAEGDNTAKGGYFYKYTTSSKTWARISRFAYNKGYSVYPDDIQFSSDGDVHLQWEWSKYPASGVRHEGSYVRYTPSTKKFRAITGSEVSVPLTQQTADIVFQPLTSGETYANDINASPAPAFQSGKLVLYEHPAGAVHIQVAYRFQAATGGPWQVRRARGDFGTAASPWTREIVYSGEDTSAGLGITHDGDTVRIYYCRTEGSTYVLERTNGATEWSNTALSPVVGKKVQRLQAKMRSDGTDVLYLGAPKNVDANTGSLYFLTVGGR